MLNTIFKFFYKLNLIYFFLVNMHKMFKEFNLRFKFDFIQY